MSTDIRFNKKKVNHFQGTTKLTAATALLAEHVGFPKTFQPWKNKFPREEIFFSSVGNFISQRWKLCVPLLEPKSSSAIFWFWTI